MKSRILVAVLLLLLTAVSVCAQQTDTAAECLKRGYEYYKGGDYRRAIAELTESVRLEPGRASAWVNRGNAYRATNDYLRALADYSEAIRLKPEHAVAWNNRGEIWFRVGDYERAIADVSEAIRLRADDKLALYNRAVCYRLKGDRERALADLRRVLALDIRHAGARLELERLEATGQVTLTELSNERSDGLGQRAPAGVAESGGLTGGDEIVKRAPDLAASDRGEIRNNDNVLSGPANDQASTIGQTPESAAPRWAASEAGQAAHKTGKVRAPETMNKAAGEGGEIALLPGHSLRLAQTRNAIAHLHVRRASGKGTGRSVNPASVAVRRISRDRVRLSASLLPATFGLGSSRTAHVAPISPVLSGAGVSAVGKGSDGGAMTLPSQSAAIPAVRNKTVTMAIWCAVLIGAVILVIQLFRGIIDRRV